MSVPSKPIARWAPVGALVGALLLGGCSSGSGSSSGPRPSTAARLEIVQPAPSQTVGPDFTLNLNLLGGKVVPASVTRGELRGDEGHIHVTLDGKLISMTYGTSQEMKGVAPGPHNMQAEFVAIDHAPFQNRVIVAVAFNVSAAAPAT